MSFNAGAIEGSLELDINPFLLGLERAASKADEFEAKYGHMNVILDMDDARAKEKLDAFDVRLDEYASKRPSATLDLNTAEAEAKLVAMKAQMDALGRSGGGAGGEGAGGGGGGLMGALIGGLALVAPALGPMTAAVGLFSAAAVAGFGAAAVSVAGYAAVVKGAMGPLMDAIKAHKQLTGAAGEAQKAFVGMSDAYHKFQTAINPGVYGVLEHAFTIAGDVLPKLIPVVNALSEGFDKALTPFGKLFNSDVFSEFLHEFGELAKETIPMMGKTLANVLGGMMNLFDVLVPEIEMISHWALDASKSFKEWTNSGANGFVKELFGYIKEYAPQMKAVFTDLFGALGAIGKALSPLVGPALDLLDGLFKGFKNIAPLLGLVAAGLAPVVKGLGWFLGNKIALYTAMGVIAGAFLLFGGPISVAVTGITLLVGAFGYLKTHSAQVKQALTPFAPAFKAVKGAIDSVKGSIMAWVDQFHSGSGKVSSSVKQIKGMVGSLKGIFDDLKILVSGAVSFIVDVWQSGVGHDVVDYAKNAFEGIVKVISGALKVIQGVLDVFVGIFTGDWGKMWQGVKEIVSGAWSIIRGLVQIGFATIKNLFAASWHVIAGLTSAGWHVITRLFSSAWSGIQHAVSTGINKVVGFFKSLPGKITGALGDLGGLLSGAGKAIMDGLFGGISAGWDKVKGLVGGMGGWISSHKGPIEVDRGLLIPHGKAIMAGLHEGMTTGWASVQSLTKNMGKAIADGFAKGTKAAKKNMVDDVTTMLNAVLSAATKKLTQLQALLANVTDMKNSVMSAFSDSGLFGFSDTVGDDTSSDGSSDTSSPSKPTYGAISKTGNTLVQAIDKGDDTTSSDTTSSSSGTKSQTALQQFLASLATSRNNVLQATAAEQKLSKWGLDPGFLKALETSGNVQLLTELAAAGQKEAKAISDDYTSIYGKTTVNKKTGEMTTSGGAIAALGDLGTASIYGTTEKKASAAVIQQAKANLELAKSVNKLEKALNTLTDDNKKNNASQKKVQKDLKDSMDDLKKVNHDFKTNLPRSTGKAVKDAMAPVEREIEKAIAAAASAAASAASAAAGAAASANAASSAATKAANTSTANAKTVTKAAKKK